MRWMFFLLVGCGKSDGALMGVQGSDTATPQTGIGLIEISGGVFTLGETDVDTFGDYMGGPGEYRTVITAHEFDLDDFLIDRYPFPGVEGGEWLNDGATRATLVALEENLLEFGRRPCTISELLYAAAGPDNNRYPYGNDYDASACDPDDENPAPMGTYAGCQSVFGVRDFQVRSTWGTLDDDVRAVLNGGGDQQPIPSTLAYGIWGGTSRFNTVQAPTNFGFHQHGDDPTRYLDDGFRVCADQAPTTIEDRAYEIWRQRVIDAGSFEGF